MLKNGLASARIDRKEQGPNGLENQHLRNLIQEQHNLLGDFSTQLLLLAAFLAWLEASLSASNEVARVRSCIHTLRHRHATARPNRYLFSSAWPIQHTTAS